jgi:flagellar hook-associated protein FlgK
MSSCKCKFHTAFSPFYSYKHTKIEFDKRMQKIVSRIKNLREEVVQLNKLVNKRNGSIVKEIAEHIDNMISKYFYVH